MENILTEAFGSLLVIYSCYKLFVFSSYKKTEASCIAVSCKWSYLGGEPSLGYGGTFQYYYEGNKIVTEDKSFLDSTKLENGKRYILYVNPKNPKIFVKKTELKYYIFFLIAGLALMFLTPLFF